MAKFWDFHESSASFWRESVHGGWATLVVLFVIFVWHSFKTFSFSFSFSFFSRLFASSSSSSSSLDSTLNPTDSSGSEASEFRPSEIVSDEDLKFLIEKLDGAPNGDEKWDNVIDKSNNLVSYSAKCCKPKDAPLKYLSGTVFEDCSPETLRDFYMDNEYRKVWDKTVVDHWQLHVDVNTGVEIGRTVKKFPLLTPREYVLAWRLWEGKDKTFYCFIKECEYPVAPERKKYVRVSYFRSGWRIKKVPGRNACEIKMYHQEDAGLNIEMAKLAFSKGIWSFICKMDTALRKYPLARSPRSSVNALTFIKRVPGGLDVSTSESSLESNVVVVDDELEKKKLATISSKKMVANGLLLAGGIICLASCHSGLGAKVVTAFILKKLNNKRNAASPSSSSSSSSTRTLHNMRTRY